jgi:hypothetical protein
LSSPSSRKERLPRGLGQELVASRQFSRNGAGSAEKKQHCNIMSKIYMHNCVVSCVYFRAFSILQA